METPAELELETEPMWRNVTHWLALRFKFSYISYASQVHLPRNSTTHGGQCRRSTCLGMVPLMVDSALLHQLVIKKMPPHMPTGQSDDGNSSVEGPCYEVCQVDNHV